MPELISHLLGDYVLQNHTMANRKTSSWFWASVHVAFYMIPFLVIVRSPWALLVIAGTHLVIDRFRLARYWVMFWGVGCEGWVAAQFRLRANQPSPPAPAPDFLAVWLLTIVDNTIHLLINHLAIRYLS